MIQNILNIFDVKHVEFHTNKTQIKRNEMMITPPKNTISQRIYNANKMEIKKGD